MSPFPIIAAILQTVVYTYHLQSLFTYYFLNPLQLGFCYSFVTETALIKVTNDLHLAKTKNHSQLSHFIQT